MSLLHDGKISQSTFDLLDKNISRLSSAITSLKEVFSKEETFWKSNEFEEAKVLESILLDFKVNHLLGGIGEDEWKQKSEIIISGLSSLRDKGNAAGKTNLKSVPPIQFSNKCNLIENAENNLGTEKNHQFLRNPLDKKKEPKKTKYVEKDHRQVRHKKRELNEPQNLDRSISPETHCMNPWKPGCRRTDVELTIYYEGQLTPICHKCWEEISKKDIEWSSV